MTDISIVIPAKNERDNIEPLVNEIMIAMQDESFEIIYVDDGSDDGTYAEIIRLKNTYPMLKVIKHESSVGQSYAVCTGVNHAQGLLIATLDADGQNDPADLPNLIAKARSYNLSEHFCIAGFRHLRKGDTKWKQWQSKIANSVRASILKDNTPDTGCGLKVYPKHTFLQLPVFDHMHRFLPALIRRLGGHIEICNVNHRARMSGVSNYTMLNRLFVGIVDMMGVAWLQRRGKQAKISEVAD